MFYYIFPKLNEEKIEHQHSSLDKRGIYLFQQFYVHIKFSSCWIQKKNAALILFLFSQQQLPLQKFFSTLFHVFYVCVCICIYMYIYTFLAYIYIHRCVCMCVYSMCVLILCMLLIQLYFNEQPTKIKRFTALPHRIILLLS